MAAATPKTLKALLDRYGDEKLHKIWSTALRKGMKLEEARKKKIKPGHKSWGPGGPEEVAGARLFDVRKAVQDIQQERAEETGPRGGRFYTTATGAKVYIK